MILRWVSMPTDDRHFSTLVLLINGGMSGRSVVEPRIRNTHAADKSPLGNGGPSLIAALDHGCILPFSPKGKECFSTLDWYCPRVM